MPPKDYVPGNVRYGVMSGDGMKPVGKLDEPVSLSCDDGERDAPYLGESTGTLRLGRLKGDISGLMDAILGVGHAAAEANEDLGRFMMAFDVLRRCPFRHDRVWRYKLERKGDRSNRHGTRYHGKTSERAVIPNARVICMSDDGRTLELCFDSGA